MPLSEWDLLLGDDRQAQAEMMSRLLRKQAAGEMMSLASPKYYGQPATLMAQGAMQGIGNLQRAHVDRAQAAEAAARQQQTVDVDKAKLAQEKWLEQQKLSQGYYNKWPPLGRGAGLGGAGGAALRNKAFDFDSLRIGLRRAVDAIKQNPDAFGFGAEISEMMPGQWTKDMTRVAQSQFRDPRKQAARTPVYRVAYQMIESMAGKALTPQETTYIRNFLPGPNEKPENIIQMYSQIDAYVAEMQQRLDAYLSGQITRAQAEAWANDQVLRSEAAQGGIENAVRGPQAGGFGPPNLGVVPMPPPPQFGPPAPMQPPTGGQSVLGPAQGPRPGLSVEDRIRGYAPKR